VAQAIASLYSDNLESYSEQLAYHYDRGGDVERAVAALLRAGEKAKQSYANEEAIVHLSRGLELLRTTPETPARERQELDYLVALGVPLVLTRGHAAPEVEAVYARAQALSGHIGDTDQRFHALMGLRRSYLHRRDPRMAHGLGEQLLALAQITGDPVQLPRAHMMHGETLYCLGEFASARTHAETGMALYDPSQRHTHVFLYGNDTGIGCRIVLALAQWYLGYPDQAAEEGRELLAMAQELSHPFTLVYARHSIAMIHQLRGEVQHVREQTEAVVRIARERGFALYLAWSTVLYGWALVQQGDQDEGIRQMHKGIAARRAMGGTALLPYSLALLAGACRQAGRLAEASEQINEALDLAAVSGDRCWEAELYRLKGELLASGGDEGQAEVCFRQAIDISHRQNARSWELRATVSLCRLWQRQGKPEEARSWLGKIYGWFTEGFGTPDLAEARTLLDA
jgi:predicted ATPase